MTFWIQRMNCNFLHWKRFTWKLTIFVLNNYILSDSKPTAFSWSLNQPHPTNSSITACLTVLFVRSIIETYGINASAFVTKTAKEMAHSIMQWKHNFYIKLNTKYGAQDFDDFKTLPVTRQTSFVFFLKETASNAVTPTATDFELIG